MPASYTHHVFTKDVLRGLNGSVKNKINNYEDIFYLFGKSFDVLFFVNPRLGSLAHNTNTNLYFLNIVKFIKENNLYNNGEVLAYLYGSICHYILDSTIHPFIFYTGGKYYLDNKKTKKYKGKHDYIEFMIDAIIYKDRNNKEIYKAKLSNEILKKIKFSLDLNNCINYAYFETFNFKGASKVLSKGLRNCRLAVRFLMTSRVGIKKFFYKLIDFTQVIKSFYARNLKGLIIRF